MEPSVATRTVFGNLPIPFVSPIQVTHVRISRHKRNAKTFSVSTRTISDTPSSGLSKMSQPLGQDCPYDVCLLIDGLEPSLDTFEAVFVWPFVPSSTSPAFSHHETGDAEAIHLLDTQGIAVEDELVANLWGAPQLAEDEATKGVEIFTLEP